MIERKYLVFRDGMIFYGDVIESPSWCNTEKDAIEEAKEQLKDYTNDAPIYIAKIIKVVGEPK
jgi:hypothetical protein